MVNVTSTAFGDFGYALGGGPGNYTGYGYKVMPGSSGSPDYHPRRPIPIIDNTARERTAYRARLLQTTNLATDYEPLPKVPNAAYVAHGLTHQGQLRPYRSTIYSAPDLSSDSSRSSSTHQKLKLPATGKQRTFVLGHSQRTPKKKPFVLPELAKRTAGVCTIDTVFHPGFAKGIAASRADTGSVVNALRETTKPPLHYAGARDGYVASIPDSEDSAMLIPHGYEDFYYTTLENLKKKRLQEAYIGTFEEHRKRRSKIVKHKIMKAEWVKRQKVHADHVTAALLGIAPREPIRIPTASLEPDYDDDFSSPKTLRAVEQARKNISGSYLNIWNMKRRSRCTDNGE